MSHEPSNRTLYCVCRLVQGFGHSWVTYQLYIFACQLDVRANSNLDPGQTLPAAEEAARWAVPDVSILALSASDDYSCLEPEQRLSHTSQCSHWRTSRTKYRRPAAPPHRGLLFFEIPRESRRPSITPRVVRTRGPPSYRESYGILAL